MNKILVVGTICNVGGCLEGEISRIYSSFSPICDLDFFLVESDSNDNTSMALEKIRGHTANFKWISLGNMSKFIPDRVDRIRYCRNRYVQYIRENIERKMWDFVVVADLDGMNTKISNESVTSCFARQDWDVCLSNQLGGYYDIYALRHPTWQPINYFDELDALRSNFNPKAGLLNLLPKKLVSTLAEDQFKRRAIYSKMLRIPRNSEWIPVDSGFGGLAIYRTAMFQKFDYSKIDKNSRNSEHIDFHLKLKQQGSKILINPSFINSHWNTYNINRFFLVRQFRRILWNNDCLYHFYLRLKRLIHCNH